MNNDYFYPRNKSDFISPRSQIISNEILSPQTQFYNSPRGFMSPNLNNSSYQVNISQQSKSTHFQFPSSGMNDESLNLLKVKQYQKNLKDHPVWDYLPSSLKNDINQVILENQILVQQQFNSPTNIGIIGSQPNSHRHEFDFNSPQSTAYVPPFSVKDRMKPNLSIHTNQILQSQRQVLNFQNSNLQAAQVPPPPPGFQRGEINASNYNFSFLDDLKTSARQLDEIDSRKGLLGAAQPTMSSSIFGADFQKTQIEGKPDQYLFGEIQDEIDQKEMEFHVKITLDSVFNASAIKKILIVCQILQGNNQLVDQFSRPCFIQKEFTLYAISQSQYQVGASFQFKIKVADLESDMIQHSDDHESLYLRLVVVDARQYMPAGWIIFPIFLEKRKNSFQVNQGRFRDFLLCPPCFDPPYQSIEAYLQKSFIEVQFLIDKIVINKKKKVEENQIFPLTDLRGDKLAIEIPQIQRGNRKNMTTIDLKDLTKIKQNFQSQRLNDSELQQSSHKGSLKQGQSLRNQEEFGIENKNQVNDIFLSLKFQLIEVINLQFNIGEAFQLDIGVFNQKQNQYITDMDGTLCHQIEPLPLVKTQKQIGATQFQHAGVTFQLNNQYLDNTFNNQSELECVYILIALRKLIPKQSGLVLVGSSESVLKQQRNQSINLGKIGLTFTSASAKNKTNMELRLEIGMVFDFFTEYIDPSKFQPVFDESKGLEIQMNHLLQFQGKEELQYQIEACFKLERKLLSNQAKPFSIETDEYVKPDKKKINFIDIQDIPLNLERVLYQEKDHLSQIFLLIEFLVINQNHVIQLYAWTAHRLFKDDKTPNLGKFQIACYKPPYPKPFELKQAKEMQFLLNFELNEDSLTNNAQELAFQRTQHKTIMQTEEMKQKQQALERQRKIKSQFKKHYKTYELIIEKAWALQKENFRSIIFGNNMQRITDVEARKRPKPILINSQQEKTLKSQKNVQEGDEIFYDPEEGFQILIKSLAQVSDDFPFVILVSLVRKNEVMFDNYDSFACFIINEVFCKVSQKDMSVQINQRLKLALNFERIQAELDTDQILDLYYLFIIYKFTDDDFYQYGWSFFNTYQETKELSQGQVPLDLYQAPAPMSLDQEVIKKSFKIKPKLLIEMRKTRMIDTQEDQKIGREFEEYLQQKHRQDENGVQLQNEKGDIIITKRNAQAPGIPKAMEKLKQNL